MEAESTLIPIGSLRELDSLIHEYVYGSCALLGSFIDPECPYYSSDIRLAIEIAEKYKLAIVPQSDGDGVRWLVEDLGLVQYSENITLVALQKEYGNGWEDICYSHQSMPVAICLCALMTSGCWFELTDSFPNP